MSQALEFEFVTSLLADPVQYQAVNKVHSNMIEDPNLRLVMRVIEQNDGRITPAIVHQDLLTMPGGDAAMREFAAGQGLKGDLLGGIQGLFTQGQIAGSAEPLVERLIDAALKRSIDDAINTIKSDRFPNTAEWGQALQSTIAARMAALGTTSSLDALEFGVDDAMLNWEFRQQNPGKITGIRLGMGDYDEIIGGVNGGEFIIEAGSSGEGKTNWMLHQAIMAALTPHDVTGVAPRVAYFSLEMSRRQMSERIIQKLAQVSMRDRAISPTDRQKILDAAAKAKAMSQNREFVMVEPQACTTLGQITRELMRLRSQENIGMAFIDYAQLISVNAESRYLGIGEIARQLKALALQLDIPIVCGAQLNRDTLKESKNGRPKVYHIADGMDLLRSADYMNLIWTPAKHMVGNTGHWKEIGVWLSPKVRNDAPPQEMYYRIDYRHTTVTQIDPAIEKVLRSKAQQNILNGIKEPATAAKKTP